MNRERKREDDREKKKREKERTRKLERGRERERALENDREGAARQPELQLRLDMYCWGGAGRDSKRHSTAQRSAAQGAE